MMSMQRAQLAAVTMLAFVMLGGCAGGSVASKPAAKTAVNTTTYVPVAPQATSNHPKVASPRSFAAVATSTRSVHLSWVAPSSRILGYWLTSQPGGVGESGDASAT